MMTILNAHACKCGVDVYEEVDRERVNEKGRFSLYLNQGKLTVVLASADRLHMYLGRVITTIF
jgi:hypothetical protein